MLRTGRLREVAALGGALLVMSTAAAAFGASRTSLLAAMPPGTIEALYVEPMEGGLEAAVDGLERVLGVEAALSFLDEAPLPYVALDALVAGRGAGSSGVVDERGGLGLFRVDGFEGAIGLMAVQDASRARALVVERLAALGGTASEEEGYTRVTLESGISLALFVHRGIAFLVLPDGDGEETLERVVSRLKRRHSGLSGTRLMRELTRASRGGVPGAALHLFIREPLGPSSAARGLLLSAQFNAGGARFDGPVVIARQPLRGPAGVEAGAAGELLTSAGVRPTLALSARLSAESLLGLVGGPASTPGRLMLLEELSAVGVLGRGRSLPADDVTMLYYADGQRLFRGLLAAVGDEGVTGLGGRLELSGRVLDASKLKELARRLERHAEVRLRTPVRGRFELSAGAPVGGSTRPWDLRESLSAGLGRTAFTTGHVSAVLDVAQLADALESGARGVGLSLEDLALFEPSLRPVQAFLARVDRVGFDLGPAPGGARLVIDVRYRKAESMARNRHRAP